jgi:Protein of unknown function (DUF2867)
MLRNHWIIVAGLASLFTVGLHVFGGGPQFLDPALASALPDIWKAAFTTIWHGVTVLLILNGVFLIGSGFSFKSSPSLVKLIALQNLAFGLMFLYWGFTMLGSPFKLPQWIIFFFIFGLCGFGVLRKQRITPQTVSECAPNQNCTSTLPKADFIDAFELVVAHNASSADFTKHILTTVPPWVDKLLALRNALMRPFGLKTSPSEVANGIEKFGMFPVISRDQTRTILGFDDKHLDFRIILDVVSQSTFETKLTLSTAVRTHNILGRTYLALVMPFHKLIAPTMLRSALTMKAN